MFDSFRNVLVEKGAGGADCHCCLGGQGIIRYPFADLVRAFKASKGNIAYQRQALPALVVLSFLCFLRLDHVSRNAA